MDSTTEAVTKTVVNKNTVKIALDEYNELVQKAARPIVRNVTVVQKTNAQAAMDQVAFGGLFAGVGAVLLVGGLAVAAWGNRKLNKQ